VRTPGVVSLDNLGEVGVKIPLVATSRVPNAVTLAYTARAEFLTFLPSQILAPPKKKLLGLPSSPESVLASLGHSLPHVKI